LEFEVFDEDLPLTPAIFNQLDVDGSGKVDVEELKAIFGSNSSKDIEVLMARVDLDGNKELDYAEFERVMNMQKNSKDDFIGKATLSVKDALLRYCVFLFLPFLYK
jgi:Ca2+-binding EF-hand superfamily protein